MWGVSEVYLCIFLVFSSELAQQLQRDHEFPRGSVFLYFLVYFEIFDQSTRDGVFRYILKYSLEYIYYACLVDSTMLNI